MGLTEYLRVIWRRKWRILGVALALAAIVHARSDATGDVYRAEVVLTATPGAGGPAGAAALAAQYANLAETRPVLAAAKASAGDVEAEATTAGFLTIHATASSPRAAESRGTAIANALVAAVRANAERARDSVTKPLSEELSNLERELGSRDLAADAPVRSALLARYQELARGLTAARVRPVDRVDIVSTARASSSPVEPTPARDALLTFLIGMSAFAVVALVIESLSDRLSAERPAEEASRITSLPVLAQIPRGGGADAVEAFRTLRTSLMFMSTSDRLRTLAVVSVDPGAGKTFVALNLAREAAALDVPVVVIDGDLRRPSVHDRLGIPRSPGLSEALASADPAAALISGRADPTGAAAEAGRMIEGWMRVIPSGAPVADPAGLFAGRAFRDALDGMTWAELVVVDTPAGGLFADALAIASQCDATLVVVDAQNSRRRAIRHLVDNLRQVSAKPIGIALNRVEPTPRPSYYDRAAGKRNVPTQRATASATK